MLHDGHRQLVVIKGDENVLHHGAHVEGVHGTVRLHHWQSHGRDPAHGLAVAGHEARAVTQPQLDGVSS